MLFRPTSRAKVVRAALALILVGVGVVPGAGAAPPADAQTTGRQLYRYVTNSDYAEVTYLQINGAETVTVMVGVAQATGPGSRPWLQYRRTRVNAAGSTVEWGAGELPVSDVSGNANAGMRVQTDTTTNPAFQVGGSSCAPTNACQPVPGARGIVDVTWTKAIPDIATNFWAGTYLYEFGDGSTMILGFTRSGQGRSAMMPVAGSVLGVVVPGRHLGSVSSDRGVVFTLWQP